MTAWTLVLAAVVLGVGTYAFRITGPLLRTRVALSEHTERLLGIVVVTLLAALFATSALYDGAQLAGYARPAGVLVGGVLAVRRAPFVIVVIAAAATAAVLRLAGVP